MTLYGEDEESLHLIRRAGAWRRAGFISEERRAAIEADAEPGLRRTGIFFRGLLSLFTLVAVQAACGLALWAFGIRSDFPLGTACLVFAAAAYAAAEREARTHRLYRHGVEEALALAALGWALGAVYLLILKQNYNFGRREVIAESLAAAAGGLWLYRRFGFLYGALIAAAGGIAAILALNLTETSTRLVMGLFFVGVFASALFRERPEDGGLRREKLSFLQGVGILGAYLSLNLRLTSLGDAIPWAGSSFRTASSIPRTFYWATHLLVWLMPASLLWAGCARRRRVWVDMGILAAALTLATNKGYLGWTHYPWDPAVFGLVLVVAAAFLSRRFRGRRTGITAEDVWKAETHGLEPAALGAAILSPTIAPSAAPPRFGGGASGGGGASSGF